MKRQFGLTAVIIIAVVAFGAGSGAGVLGWIWLSGGSGVPSESAVEKAPQLSLGSDTTTGTTTVNTDSATTVPAPRLSLGSESTPEATPEGSGALIQTFAKPRPMVFQQPATTEQPQPATTEQIQPASTEEPPTETPAPSATPVPTTAPSTSAISITRGLYRINPAKSSVTFALQEDLRGTRTDVIGTTQDVGGDMIVDFTNPSASQVGGLVINARSLATDNDFRNRALRGQILRSAEDAYEFINFTPTAISGLEGVSVAVGQAITFQLTGNLTIIETTLPVTFDVTATLNSEQELVGSASATLNWADFNIVIPNAPGVANITPEVTLSINFTADLIESEGGASTALDYSQALFRMNDQSSVTFALQEDLQGTRTDVIGTTNQVGGDIIVDVTNPSASQVGGIVINARSLATDNDFRNRALRGQILRASEDKYEFINFIPTAISGLEGATVAVGQPVTFQVTGNLTIIETTLPVTFDVTATLETPDVLTGTATVVLNWADFNIVIPNVPGVANITPEVTLTLTFVADLVQKQ